jgi:FtsH-binding integral membrane protein
MAVAAASAEFLDTNAQLERAVDSKLVGTLLSVGIMFTLLFAVFLTRPGSPMKYAAFAGFAVMIGQTLKPLVARLQDTKALARILALTTGVFVGMMAVGFYDRQNLLGFGPYLLAGLLGLILVQILIVLLATPAEKGRALDWIRALGVAIFAAFTAYDVQVLKAGATGCRVAKKAGLAPDYPRESLGLFLDFANLFSYIGGSGNT